MFPALDMTPHAESFYFGGVGQEATNRSAVVLKALVVVPLRVM